MMSAFPRIGGGWAAVFLTAALLVIAGAAVAAAVTDYNAAADTSTTEIVELPELTVSGEAAAAPIPGRAVIKSPAVTLRDPGSLADLGGLFPSSRVAVNSRGESTLMIRGAPERHVQTFLDGIPLNLPWDERADLGTIPITGGGRVEVRRGLSTLLAGPGVLAGSVRILPPRLDGREQRTRVNASLEQEGGKRTGISHQRVAGPWTVLGAGAWREQDRWRLPAGIPGGYPPDASIGTRFNSDVRQTSIMLRATRPVDETGRLNFLATAWSVEKGVPPEMHLGEDARFWRYPLRQRALLGASLSHPLGKGHHWDLNAMTAIDFFRQEIDPRGPDGWDKPLETGQDYEKDLDRTGHLQMGLTRWLGEHSRVSLQGNARYSDHRESLVVGGPREAYAQWLSGLVVETETRPFPRLILRSGAGWDHSATPESGDKTCAPGFDEPALSMRLGYELSRRSELYASAGRRSRMPSLRELYSGALGRFVPNPELVPEQQDLLEIGCTARGDGWNLAGAAFLQTLRDGIEKEALPGPDRQFMRVNRTGIRVPGIEFSGRWRSASHMEIALHHAILAARVKEDDSYDRPAEDRPDYLSQAEIGWRPDSGPSAHLEATVTGPRWSADATDPVDGMKRLPAGVVWNLRFGWAMGVPLSGAPIGREMELHVRWANLFDQPVDYQTGLPGPGRTLSAGLSAGF